MILVRTFASINLYLAENISIPLRYCRIDIFSYTPRLDFFVFEPTRLFFRNERDAHFRPDGRTIIPSEHGGAWGIQAANILALALRHSAIGFQQVTDVGAAGAGG